MEYRNTTDIPTDLVKVVIAFASQSGVELKRIELRNKENGKMHGQFGWYFQDRRIRLIVPPIMPENGIPIRLIHFKQRLVLKDRIEFVVAVLAHELRHAWQFQVSPDKNSFIRCNRHCEFDAERYEYQKLMEWRDIVYRG